jgi:hypothetical protein
MNLPISSPYLHPYIATKMHLGTVPSALTPLPPATYLKKNRLPDTAGTTLLETGSRSPRYDQKLALVLSFDWVARERGAVYAGGGGGARLPACGVPGLGRAARPRLAP